MLNISQRDLLLTLQQLEQAIYNHEQWLKDVTRTIICHLPYDQREVAEDAYRHCRFGQWYYGNPPQAIRDHPAFVAIEIEHRRMHQLGAQLLLDAANGVLESPLDYDSFTNAEERLRLEIYSLKHELDELLLNRDVLTGAENRFSMLATLRELSELVKRHVQPCSIVIMDLDHFKEVNDTYGHGAGDKVLVSLVRYVKQNMRPYDKVYRYGGEEFLLALPSTDLQDAHVLIERLREGFAKEAIDVGGPKSLRITASFGITMLDPDASVEETINRADTALYAAKTSGRNCTCIWEPSMKPKQELGNGLPNPVAKEIES